MIERHLRDLLIVVYKKEINEGAVIPSNVFCIFQRDAVSSHKLREIASCNTPVTLL